MIRAIPYIGATKQRRHLLEGGVWRDTATVDHLPAVNSGPAAHVKVCSAQRDGKACTQKVVTVAVLTSEVLTIPYRMSVVKTTNRFSLSLTTVPPSKEPSITSKSELGTYVNAGGVKLLSGGEARARACSASVGPACRTAINRHSPTMVLLIKIAHGVRKWGSLCLRQRSVCEDRQAADWHLGHSKFVVCETRDQSLFCNHAEHLELCNKLLALVALSG